MRWMVRLEITVDESGEEGVSRYNDDGTETFYKYGKIQRLFEAIKYYKKKYGRIKYRVVLWPRLHSFFTFFLMQNDYLFPPAEAEGEEKKHYPFSGPHLWKTRIGFKTAWRLSK